MEEILQHAKGMLQKAHNDDARMLLVELIHYDPKNRPALMMLAGSYFIFFHDIACISIGKSLPCPTRKPGQ
ncbi:MAG TPA: hypothetical protein EYP91_06720 [Gammaproteobacteria bacterium]|nr:hypothetical protein [Gammaproteobacteria bacterium]